MSTPDFEQLLAAKTGTALPDLPGCVLAAVNKQDSSPIQAGATFWLASCTKLIGTVAALQCVERSQIHPDDTLGFSLASAKSKITLRQLLTHTSGLGYDFVYPELMAWRASRGEEPLSLSCQLVKAYSTPLLLELGEGWVYGGGIDWAGELVARLNKTTLEDYMREHIPKPLGMNSTSFHLELRRDIKTLLAETAQRADDGILQSSQKVWLDHVPEDYYLKVMGDLIKDTPTLFSRETIEREMFTPQLPENSLALRSLLSAPDLVSSMTGSTGSGVGINHGLGGLYFGADIGNVKKGTLTWGGLPNLKWFMNGSEGVAALYATQLMPPGDPACAELTRAFFDEVWRLNS
ncbi:beta-lactamase/transpeptidase-like protein [Aspergillus insuetus]